MIHFFDSSTLAVYFKVRAASEFDPPLRVVSAFLRSPRRESISLRTLYYFWVPNLKGGAMSDPSMVSAVAFDIIVATLRSL